MEALQSLTALFTQHVTDAKSLDVWAEDGELICTQGSFVDGFDIAYTVNINMTGVDVQPHILMMHLVTWFNKYDMNRDEKGLPTPSFATELLDKGKCDIKLKIDIRESYSLNENVLGNWQQNETRYECISDFHQAVTEDELPTLEFIKGPEGDLPLCS
ncbi:phage tail protein [Moritella sp. F3]|uniref:phage tail protein n=1 Tax=Moritella sp. F3 TaxID=2718882 RepID=UPI0018E10ADF|nr:phage tail protein [Moritella sp. F3]GIC79501.1 hypothetical protein FMO001_42280 [Moritella sp. F1]GIC79779.1 hypothetical protein FMO003_00600 [Moritella sp. F3]